MTDWGREIIVDGKRPSWLADNDRVCVVWNNGVETFEARPFNFPIWGGSIRAIRLPADHWVYRALDAGFEPWGGGDSAPDDCSGRVLLRDGAQLRADQVYRWTHCDSSTDIIGYHRRAEPTLRTADEALQRMEALVRRMAARKRAIPSGPIEDDHAEATAIVKLLPEPPVDPDLIEARKIMADIVGTLADNPSASKDYLSGKKDSVPAMQAVLVGIKRGRELAGQ